MRHIFCSFLLISLISSLKSQTNFIRDTGNVGIGTLSPIAKQHIVSSASGASPTLGMMPSLVLEHSGFSGQLQFLTHSHYASFLMFGDERGYSRGSITYDHREASEKLSFGVNSTTRMSIVANGNTGIGSTSPSNKLVISNEGANGFEVDPVTGSNSGTNLLSINRSSGSLTQLLLAANNFVLTTGNVSNALVLTQGGLLGIGTSAPTEKLSVTGNVAIAGNLINNGTITSKKITITQTGWSDYVFDETYRLRSLGELETYVKQNKHLPDIPTAREVEEKGISIGDNQALLLKKIEELTLYVIAQQKEIDGLKKQVRNRK